MARRLRRSRRGVTHSAIATIFGVGLALAPLTIGPAGVSSPLQSFQQGNWAVGLNTLSVNLVNNWATYLFALVPIVIVAIIAKKFAHKLHLSKHWTV